MSDKQTASTPVNSCLTLSCRGLTEILRDSSKNKQHKQAYGHQWDGWSYKQTYKILEKVLTNR